ncbi:MAG: helix-hairpin-helix domain-containing protein [Solirubrobacterales bacterium]
MSLDRRAWVALAGAAVLAAVLLVPKVMPGAGASGQGVPAAPGSPGAVLERKEPGEALVHVAGAVRRPGVYRVGGAARVRDAIRRAGGGTGQADLDAINLAARLADGQQVVVPRKAPVAGPPGASGAAPAEQVSLGSATAEQLDTLDGVGPVMAEKIVEWRTARGGVGSVDELDEIPGIGPKKLEALRDQLAP